MRSNVCLTFRNKWKYIIPRERVEELSILLRCDFPTPAARAVTGRTETHTPELDRSGSTWWWDGRRTKVTELGLIPALTSSRHSWTDAHRAERVEIRVKQNKKINRKGSGNYPTTSMDFFRSGGSQRGKSSVGDWNLSCSGGVKRKWKYIYI